MDTYVINGVEMELDTFDLDVMDRLEKAVKCVQDDIDGISRRKEEYKSTTEMLRDQGNAILDFFDDVFGDGSSRKIFGTRMNIMQIATGFQTFIEAVTAKNTELSKMFKPAANESALWMNREQRRAAARNRR